MSLFSKKNINIGIIGFGSWGMALAIVLENNGHKVTIWDINKERIDSINITRVFDLIPSININKSINLSNDLVSMCNDSDLIIFAVPSHAVRSVSNLIKDSGINLDKKIILTVVKGIEENTYFNMSEIIIDVLKLEAKLVYALSGPTHAEEVSKKILTTVIIAGLDNDVLLNLQSIFSNTFFRVYISKDIKGVELGGAVKNVIAIAAGISDGLGLGDNAKAAIITRGLSEIAKLGSKIGANPETFYGLSGLGDLVVTCISAHSRNRYFGEQLGKGLSSDDILKEMKMVAEGVNAAKSIYKLAKKANIEMPIVKEIYDIIYNKKTPKNAVKNLMERDLKEEKIF